MISKLSLIGAAFLLLLSGMGSQSLAQESWKGCVGIDIGTMPNEHDVVSNGQVEANWKVGSNIPYYVGSDDKFEFLYINSTKKQSDGELEDLMEAKWTIKATKKIDLQPIVRKNTENQYELELDYRCSTDISAIIGFDFNMQIDNCDLTIHWKKECLKYSRPIVS
jgi:uncharacterized protein YfcZ (UPF0381/DUF406 family)